MESNHHLLGERILNYLIQQQAQQRSPLALVSSTAVPVQLKKIHNAYSKQQLTLLLQPDSHRHLRYDSEIELPSSEGQVDAVSNAKKQKKRAKDRSETKRQTHIGFRACEDSEIATKRCPRDVSKEFESKHFTRKFGSLIATTFVDLPIVLRATTSLKKKSLEHMVGVRQTSNSGTGFASTPSEETTASKSKSGVAKKRAGVVHLVASTMRIPRGRARGSNWQRFLGQRYVHMYG